MPDLKEELRKLIYNAKIDPQVLEKSLELIDQGLDPELQEAVKRRTKALDSFQSFLDTYFAHYFTIPSGPQQKELTKLVESLKDRPKRKSLKYSRAVSRGFGKSTIVSLCAVLWLVLRGDWKFVLLVSASLPHAEGFLRKISDEIEGNDLLVADFSELEPARDSNGTTVAWNDRHLVFAGGFAIIAKGFRNQIRGLRYKNFRPDALVIDDPDEYSHIESPTTMERRYRWLERSALKVGGVLSDLDVIIIYTTIASNCIGEYIYIDKENKFSHFNRKKFKALETLPDGSEKSCWEHGAPTDLLVKEREKDPLAFASERQNEPLPEAGQCFRGRIQTYVFERPSNLRDWQFALAVDESLGKSEKSNPSAIIGVGMAPDGVMYEVYNSITIRRPDQIISDLLVVLQLYPWEKCGIDTSGNQEHFLDRVEDAVVAYNKTTQTKILVPLVGLKDSSNKQVRIRTALQPMIATGKVKIREDSKTLLEHLNNFPYGHLDGPDALEYAVRLLRTGTHVHEISGTIGGVRKDGKQVGKTAEQVQNSRINSIIMRAMRDSERGKK